VFRSQSEGRRQTLDWVTKSPVRHSIKALPSILSICATSCTEYFPCLGNVFQSFYALDVELLHVAQQALCPWLDISYTLLR